MTAAVSSPTRAAPKRWAELSLIAWVVALRLPYVGLGFGSDWDAWLLAASGRRLVSGGGYVPSRPPGYPLSELVFGCAERFGPVATNLVSVIASVFVALALARLLEPAGRMRALLITACAMSLPIVIVAGSSTMDYMPSLALFSWALVFAERKSPILSAVLLVLSVAARPATLAFAPVWLALVVVRSGSKPAVRAALIAGVGIVLCAIPALMTLGLSGMRPSIGGYPGRWIIARRVWNETFGAIGFVTFVLGAGFVVIAPFALGRRAPDASASTSDASRRVRACLLWIGILGCAVYLWIPYEAGYLVPSAIAGVAWVGMQLPSRPLYVYAAALVLSTYVDPVHGSTALSRDAEFRRQMVQVADALRAAAPKMPRPAIVVTGFLGPQWTYVVDESDGLRGMSWISAEQIAEFHASGQRVYFIPAIAAWHRRLHRVDLAEHGAIPLPTSEAILLGGIDYQD